MKRIGRRAAIAVLMIIIMLQAGFGLSTRAVTPTSQAQVEFTVGTGPTFPADPDTLVPGTDQGTETSGSFVFVHISDFEFQSLETSSKAQEAAITTTKPNIQIADLRGVDTGWKVKAQLSRFSDTDTNESLLGTSIVISDIEAASESVSGAPTLKGQQPVTIVSGGSEVTVLSAGQNAGLGHWVIRWYNKTTSDTFVKLAVPAGSATVGEHTATINWILENGP